jgi:aminopeptidase
MTDERILKFADILVDYCTEIQPGDRVIIESTTLAEPLLEALIERILKRGGRPYPITRLPNQDKIYLTYAEGEQLATPHPFMKLAYEEFEARIRLHSLADTNALKDIPAEKQALASQGAAPILKSQFQRGPSRDFKWVTTLYPTEAYAKDAGMTLAEYEDFVYGAIRADKPDEDPVDYWQNIEKQQQRYVDLFDGKDKVVLRGPNVDLRLSIKGRTMKNSSGRNNMPDGEIFTGPVENSVNGWVRFTYPCINGGNVFEGVELEFVEGRVLHAKAKTNQDLLLKILDVDPGARYVGEFAIGLNFGINKFTGQILFDEKIGGSFHMALGAGYPETGSKNESSIHWDMICDMREDAEITVDGDVVYRNGEFVE